jgi:Lipoxygenase
MPQAQPSDPPVSLTEKQEQQEFAASLELESSEIPLRRTDLHTRFMVSRVRERVTQWTAQGPSAAGIPQTHGPLEKIDVIPGILAVPAHDEDGDKIAFAKKALFRVLRALPLTDDADPWASTESASTVIAQFEPILPTPTVRWIDVTSDRATTLLAFQGLGAHRLEPLDADPGGAAYAVDLSWMYGLAVRPGLEPYGACASFAADRTLLRMYTSHDDRTHYPGDASWEEAKWRWRCALFTAVTVTDHLAGTHFLASNLLVTVTREQLPEDHPLRRLLKPYGYGAVDVNVDAALMLAPEGGLAHRLFSFTYAGLSRCLLRGIETAKFQTFPQAMAAKRIEALGDRFPYATDGLALYAILQTYAKDYFDIFFPGESVVQDPAVRAWWQGFVALAPSLNLGPLNKAQQVIDLVTQAMFIVTGFHAQVGHAVPYLLDPAFISCRVRSDAQMSDIQPTVQVLNLAALTALEQPSLIGDYPHLFLDLHKERVIAAFERYQQALIKLSRNIDERNKHREQPFETFNPRLLKVSVST